MDEQVMGAMQKWPNVPAVYGWLSLNEQGEWLLHTDGRARDGQDGEKIANEQIRSFMNRNYAATEKGEWFFQNGPQRVFADLARAPFIVRLADDSATLVTHNGLTVTQVTAWILSDAGQLYMQTEHGAGMLAGRDMGLLTPRLLVSAESTLDELPLDQPHLESLEAGNVLQVSLDGKAEFTAPMRWQTDRQIPDALGFVRQPVAS